LASSPLGALAFPDMASWNIIRKIQVTRTQSKVVPNNLVNIKSRNLFKLSRSSSTSMGSKSSILDLINICSFYYLKNTHTLTHIYIYIEQAEVPLLHPWCLVNFTIYRS
jgi:hypothetical protein